MFSMGPWSAGNPALAAFLIDESDRWAIVGIPNAMASTAEFAYHPITSSIPKVASVCVPA
jgi:hypothetical protein